MSRDSSAKKTPAVLIIACGNLNRADDAAGALVAERLRDLGIAVRICDGAAPDLMEAWSAADNVIVVDCVVTGAPAGTVQIWDASRPLPLQRTDSTHGLGLAEAVELARAIGCLPARLRIYGIEGKNFDIGGAVSVEVKGGVSEAVKRIAAEAGK
ncbi:MAG TPA: hydrogenase maturation protease [Candidatus Binatia bacterium]|nr:hydrogenase maturation protease [Candidatus Binatia bacterium]